MGIMFGALNFIKNLKFYQESIIQSRLYQKVFDISIILLKWLLEGFTGLIIAMILSFITQVHDPFLKDIYDKFDEKIIEILNIAVEKLNGTNSQVENGRNSTEEEEESINFIKSCLKIKPEYK